VVWVIRRLKVQKEPSKNGKRTVLCVTSIVSEPGKRNFPDFRLNNFRPKLRPAGRRERPNSREKKRPQFEVSVEL